MWTDLERFVVRLDELQKFLRIAPSLRATANWLSATEEARAMAIVCAMAEFEALLATCVIRTNEAINSEQLTVNGLRPSLRSVATHSEFVSLSSLSKPSKIWPKRQRLTSLENCMDPVELRTQREGNEPLPPFDGKTPRIESVERVIGIYGLNLDSSKTTAGASALRKLADARNDIAHGNLSFSRIFSRQGFQLDEISEDLLAIEQLAFVIVEAFDVYLVGRSYIA